MKSRTAGEKTDPKPKRRSVRISLLEEDFRLLEAESLHQERPLSNLAELLFSNAIRSAWTYAGLRIRRGEESAIASARDFLLDLYERQQEALQALQTASCAPGRVASAAADRCQRWIDTYKLRASATGPKVIDGKFRSAPKGSAS